MQMEEMREELRRMGLLGQQASHASLENLLVHLLRTVTVESRLRFQREQEIIDLLTVKGSASTSNSAVLRILGEGA